MNDVWKSSFIHSQLQAAAAAPCSPSCGGVDGRGLDAVCEGGGGGVVIWNKSFGWSA